MSNQTQSDCCEIMPNITVENVTEVVAKIAYLSGRDDVTMEQIKNNILSGHHTIIGFTNKFMRRYDNFDKSIQTIWLNTGYFMQEPDYKGNDRPIFISVIRTGDAYAGFFANAADALIFRIKKYNPQYESEIEENFKRFLASYNKKMNQTEDISEGNNNKTVLAYTYLSDISETVYDSLLIHNWHSICGLDKFLKLVGCRLETLVKQNRNEFFIMNDKKYVIVNTGLFDKFGNDIKVIYRYHKKNERFEPFLMIQSKLTYIENGFTKEQASEDILPIRLYDKDDIFDAEYKDFDINFKALEHIVEERRDRFPEMLKNVGASIIADKIDKSLKIAIEMNKRDDSYIKPYFCSGYENISWAIPLHIETEMGEKPELIMVCKKSNEYFYEIKTILPYDEEVQDKLLAVKLYSNLW